MPTIHELIKDVPLPRMVRVRQTFPDGTIVCKVSRSSGIDYTIQ